METVTGRRSATGCEKTSTGDASVQETPCPYPTRRSGCDAADFSRACDPLSLATPRAVSEADSEIWTQTAGCRRSHSLTSTATTRTQRTATSTAWATVSSVAACRHPPAHRAADPDYCRAAAARMYPARCRTRLDRPSSRHGPLPEEAHGTEAENATGRRRRPDRSRRAVRARDQSPDLGRPVVLRATSRRLRVRLVRALLGRGARALRVGGGLLLLLFRLRSAVRTGSQLLSSSRCRRGNPRERNVPSPV